ncbi:MAG: hypothetical protein WBP13_05985 [Methylophilaceae bacterium]
MLVFLINHCYVLQKVGSFKTEAHPIASDFDNANVAYIILWVNPTATLG